MKKYKLIKEYPGSPKIGAIAKSDKIDYVYYYLEKDSHTGIGSSIIENNPEFWKEVVEKDYEILSVITNNNKFIEKVYNQDATIEPYWKIHSVKRLSDGEIFTIGDKVVGYNNSTAKIKTIDLVGEVSLNICTDKHEGFSLENLKKINKLFKTEDGVDVFEGDKYYPVCEYFNLHNECIYPSGHKMFKLFSTKEKAEEYIIMNKPCLSINDVLSVGQRVIVDEGKLKQIVKSKI